MILWCFKKHLENLVNTETLHCYVKKKKIETGGFIGDCEVLPVFFEAS